MTQSTKSRSGRRKLIAIFATATTVALLLGLALSNLFGQEEGSSTQVHQLNRSLTIGDITVSLSEAHEDSDTLKLHHSYTSDLPDDNLIQLDRTEVWQSGTKAGRSHSETSAGSATMSTLDWNSPLTENQAITVNAGSFLVGNASISGSSTISLGSGFSASASSNDEVTQISLNATLSATGRSYHITRMTIVRKEDLEPVFHLTLVPDNPEAERTELVSFTGASHVTLTDSTGASYSLRGVRTRWNSTESNKTVRWQQLSFTGTPSSDATEMNLDVQGGSELVGPFVFKDIRLD